LLFFAIEFEITNELVTIVFRLFQRPFGVEFLDLSPPDFEE
jgi:hypothetical protein